MYDELIKSLRNMSKIGTKYGIAVVRMREAADAIEELQQQVEHYHGCMNDWFQEACDLKVMNEQQAKNFDILFNIVLKIVEQIAERLNIETSQEPQKEER